MHKRESPSRFVCSAAVKKVTCTDILVTDDDTSANIYSEMFPLRFFGSALCISVYVISCELTYSFRIIQ